MKCGQARFPNILNYGKLRKNDEHLALNALTRCTRIDRFGHSDGGGIDGITPINSGLRYRVLMTSVEHGPVPSIES